MPTPLADIARLVGGDLVGDGQVQISGAAALADAGPATSRWSTRANGPTS